MFKFDTKTHSYVKLTDKELAFNWEKYSKKDARPYVIGLTASDDHSPIIVDALILPNNSEHTFVCSNLIRKHMFT